MNVETDAIRRDGETKAPLSATERVALSLALSQISPLILITQGIFTGVLAKELQLPKNELETITFSVLGLASVLGFLYEADTLRRVGLTINPGTVIASLKIRSPEIATLLGTLYGHLYFLTNPVDMTSTIATLTTNEDIHRFLSDLLSHIDIVLPGSFPGAERLFLTNLLSRSIIGFSASIIMNWTIRHGLAENVLAKGHQLTDFVTETALRLVSLFAKPLTSAALAEAVFEGSMSLEEAMSLQTNGKIVE